MLEEVVAPLGADLDEVRATVASILKRFGHLDEAADIGTGDDFESHIADFQDAMGLAGTGNLDLLTVNSLTAPRCGVPDRLVSVMAEGDAWQKNKLTYWVKSGAPAVPGASAEGVMRDAFALWAEVTGLEFTPFFMDPDISIEFVPTNHGDGIPFDGPGKVLAHAFYPPPNDPAGNIHFDNAETWTNRMPKPPIGYDLFTVALHEIGHSLGLSHSSDPAAIMYPTIGGVQRSLGLDDIRRIRRLYSGGVTPSPPSPIPPIPPLNPKPPSPSPGPVPPSPPPSAPPWQDPTTRGYINEWVMQANRCFKQVEPGAYIDQWGRWCGRRKNGVVSTCNQSPDPPGWTSQQYLWSHDGKVENYPYRVRQYVNLRLAGTSYSSLANCG